MIVWDVILRRSNWFEFQHQIAVCRIPELRFRGPGIPVGLSLFLPHPITFGFMPTPGTYRLTPAEGKSLGLIFKSEDHLWGIM